MAKINLDTPILDRSGRRMTGGTAEAPGAEATVGVLIFQTLDTPISADAQAGVANRLATARLGRKLGDGTGQIELDSSEVTLIIDRAAAQLMMSVVFEQLVEAIDPARLRA